MDSCGANDIDLSTGAFDAIGSEDAGKLNGESRPILRGAGTDEEFRHRVVLPVDSWQVVGRID